MDKRTSTAETQQSYHYPVVSLPQSSSPSITASSTTTTTTAPKPVSAAAGPTPSSTSTPTATTASSQYPHALDGSLDVATPVSSTATGASAHFPSTIDFLPYWLPHQSNIYYAQLLHYNKLVSPTRGGGLQGPPLPPVVSASNAQAGPRSRSSSKVSLKDSSSGKGTAGGGHGNRAHHNSDKNRSVITSKEAPSAAKMAPRTAQSQAQASESSRNQQNPRPTPSPSAKAQSHVGGSGVAHSSSVPSTPHQRARQFSFESRDPSPNEAANNHSPRSAYSETNSTLPSLRPLPPPRHGPCKYETAQVNSRRRVPYSIGNERLEKMPLGKIKGKLTEDEERKVATDMREVYDRILPSERVEEKRRKLVRKLEKIFNDEWPGHDITAHLFGSSGNLLCSDDSDVDICITTSWHAMESVCMIADLLAKRGMEKVVCISQAKVPIVKIWDPELELACDMNVNNTLALENTRMIRVYVETDPRVRQLAMIVKYWTRRRIVNDAAFGGTLSSYTWICLIIAFLQLRTPPVLPALHQLPYKTPKPDGASSDFADNLKKLKGYGSKNKSSEADLLFQFFRFYAHEFDYDKWVLSIRLGKLITKTDKKWHYAINNQLCVEEPFNTSRNLGNTADEYSFRGLHLELRRAFDLLSEGKFEEACEPYVFPKEEERVWSRPPPQPRPVLVRSSSQTHNGSGRGGRGGRGGRHNYHRGGGGGGSSRRASSSIPTYDTSMFQPVNIQQDLSWYQSPQFPFQYTQELMAQMAFQQENMRQLQMYAQSSPAYGQQQGMAQPMMASNSSSGQTQSSDRSRTNSFDNPPPLSAPLRPELFAFYNMTLGAPYFAQAGTGYGTYPSSPSTTNGVGQDFRRPLQRTNGATDKGAATSSGSLRSQSQPAARSPSTVQPAVPGQPLIPISQSATNVPNTGGRNPNGVPIPSFMSDETDFDETPKANLLSPQSEDKGANYFAPENASTQATQHQQPQGATNGIAFGDMTNQSSASSSPGRRRLSTDQLPQSVLDRRMRRTSRSPSPLGHSRAFSAGTGPGGPTAQNRNSGRPLVVNGSGLKTSVSAAPQTPSTEGYASRQISPSGIETPLHGDPVSHPSVYAQAPQQPQMNEPIPTAPVDQPPIVVNGSQANPAYTAPDDTSFRERIAMLSSQYMNPQYLAQDMTFVGNGRLSPSARQQLMSRQPQNAVIAPLDLAISDDRVRKSTGSDPTLLSPVYEHRTSSPVTARKSENSGKADKANHAQGDSKKSTWAGAAKHNQKTDEHGHGAPEAAKQGKAAKPATQSQKTNGTKENGHTRGARSESDGTWQKASGKGKKKGANISQQGHAEPPPKNTSERKGG